MAVVAVAVAVAVAADGVASPTVPQHTLPVASPAGHSLPATYAPPHFVLYNRIPKCGSTTVISVLRHLSRRRAGDTLGVDKGAKVSPAIPSGRQFAVSNAHKSDFRMRQPFKPHTKWSAGWSRLKSLATLANSTTGQLYINHLHYPNLTAAGLPQPLAFNVMREPIAREVSAYYYLMWGPRPKSSMVVRREKLRKMTGLDHEPSINEYLEWSQTQPDSARCLASGNMQTRYFCGFAPECDEVCSGAALARAKRTLREEYVVVGFTDRLNDTFALLERAAPDWFNGVAYEYAAMTRKAGHGHLRTHAADGHHEPATEASTKLLAMHHSQDVKLHAYAQKIFAEKLRAYGLA